MIVHDFIAVELPTRDVRQALLEGGALLAESATAACGWWAPGSEGEPELAARRLHRLVCRVVRPLGDADSASTRVGSSGAVWFGSPWGQDAGEPHLPDGRHGLPLPVNREHSMH